MSALSFLSKKSWHTALNSNQEAVWKAEKAALEERRKLDELRKERNRERELQELERLQEQAGGRKARTERVDWMYNAPASGAQVDKNELEEYLLGKKRVDKLLKGSDETTQLSRQGTGSSNDPISAQTNINSDRDMSSKIREDPMLAIRQQEQAAYQALLKDPARLRAMRKAAGLDDGKTESREERHRRKEEKRRRRDEEKYEHRRESGRRYRDDVERDDRHASRDRRDEREYDRRRGGDEERRHGDDNYSRRRDDDDGRRASRSHRYDERDREERRRGDDAHERRRDIDNDSRGDRSYPYRRNEQDYRERAHNADRPTLRDDRRQYDRTSRNTYDRRSRSRSRSPAYRQDDRRQSRRPLSPRRDSAAPARRPDQPVVDTAAADREAKLAAMQKNAAELTTSRSAYLAKVQADEQADLAREEALREKVRASRGKHNGGGGGFGAAEAKGSFLLEQERSLYGSTNNMDLAERLRRGRDGLQRFEGGGD